MVVPVVPVAGRSVVLPAVFGNLPTWFRWYVCQMGRADVLAAYLSLPGRVGGENVLFGFKNKFLLVQNKPEP